MKTRTSFLSAILIWPVIVVASAFTDPVLVESVSDAKDRTITLRISPPGVLSEREASWPLCVTVRVKVPPEPEYRTVTAEQHRAALERLRQAAKSKSKLHFGPAGRGLVQSKEDRCLLFSKGLTSIQRSDGKTAVLSFHD